MKPAAGCPGSGSEEGGAGTQPRHTDRPKIGPAMEDRAKEAAMSSLFQTARDNASDMLATAAACVYFLGFFAAVQAALDKLSY